MDSDLQALLKKVLKDPSILNDPEAVSDEQVAEITPHLNPYNHVPQIEANKNPDQVRTAFFSYTNLREEYLQNLAMTSLAGYIFRAHYEHKIPAADRRWYPAKKRKKLDPYSIEELVKHVDMLSNLSSRLKIAQEEYEKACDELKEYQDKDLVFTQEELDNGYGRGSKIPKKGSVVADKMARFHELQNKANSKQDSVWGIRYAITLMMRNFGVHAEERIVNTEKEAKKFPDTARVIESAPDRFGGILPGGQQEVPERIVKKLIHDFLAKQFEYNPDAHVRKAHDKAVLKSEKTGDIEGLVGKQWVDPFDSERIPIEALKANPPKTTVDTDIIPLKVVQKKQHWYNTVCCLLETPELAKEIPYILENKERFRRLLLPKGVQHVNEYMLPADVFHKWRRYHSENYDSLVATTNSLFAIKPDLDFMLVLYDINNGTREEVNKKWDEFKDKHQSEVMTDIHHMDIGSWTVLTDRKENYDKMDFMNRTTSLIDRMLKAKERDKKIGSQMVRKRVTVAKAKNIAEQGADAPGLNSYKDGYAPKGQKPILSAKERKRMEAARGNLEAIHDIEYFEQHDQIVKRLESEAKYRKLTDEEQNDLRISLEQRQQAEEALEVPDGALQVDVNIVELDENGEQVMRRDKMYTKAEDLKYEDGGDAPPAPFDDTRPLAPFAQKYLDKELEKECTDIEKNVQKQKSTYSKAIDSALDKIE